MNSRRVSRMVRVFILVVLVLCASLFLVSPAGAANGSFAWAKRMGAVNQDGGEDIEVDAAGNVYMTGTFEGTVDFDPGPGTHNLTSAGIEDIFVAKLDRNGNFVWARKLGGPEFEDVPSLAVDASGNVYATGSFFGTVDFDPGPGTASLTSSGWADIFIVKLDTDGDFVWARGISGAGSAWSYHIEVDSAGDVYTTGGFLDTSDFDPGPGTHNLTSSGFFDSFISKLDGDGNFVWARTTGGLRDDTTFGLAVDASGNVYTSGYFQVTVDFDPGPGTHSLTSAGDYDIFVSKLDRNGKFVWVRGMGGSGIDAGTHLSVDSSGNVYTTGGFSGTVDFDPGPGSASLTSAGASDMFISKLDSNGDFIWTRAMGGSYEYIGDGLSLDVSGNVYTTGTFYGTVDFDPGPGTYNLTSAGIWDIFVAKLDADGNFIWARGMGGTANEVGRALALHASGSIYVTGDFRGSADFDPGAAAVNLTSAGLEDIFLIKLEEGAIFADVPLGYWALGYVERLYLAGITDGCATALLRYCPEDTVTRAQMAVFLLRGIHTAAYIPPDVSVSTGFADVPVDYWAAAFIKQLAAEGITSGCSSGHYCPEQPVTRAQMAVFLLRSKYGASYIPPDVGSTTGFVDVPPNYWATAWIKQLVTEGITAGCGGGNYCPDAPVTRAQMAVFLVRTFDLP